MINYNRMKDIRASIAMELGFVTGLRANELRGIKYHNIDYEHHIIDVYESFGDTGDGTEGLLGVKNGSSIRTVPYPESLDSKLKWCELHSKDKLWLMEDETGNKPITQDVFLKRCFKRPAKKLGITKNINTRTMRHFYITYMLEAGINKFDLKSATGHSTTRMIDKVYRENTIDTKRHLQKSASLVLNLIHGKELNIQ